MVTLCEECFPFWEHVRTLAIGHLQTKCDGCGKLGGSDMHSFTSDPREDFVKLGDNAWKVKEGVLK